MRPKEVEEDQDAVRSIQREFLALQEIIASMQSTSELKEVLAQISKAIVQVLGYDNSLIALLDRDKNVFKPAAIHAKLGQGLVARIEEVIGKKLLDFEIPVERDYSEAARALLDGEVYLTHSLSDLLSPPLKRITCFAMQQQAKARTMANIPLPGSDGIIGSILVTTPRKEITETELQTLVAFASQAGIVVQRARLHEEVERQASEKRKAEQKVREQAAKLRESRAFIESLFSAIADPIVVTNPDKVILAVNRATTELLGYQEDELVGHSYIDVLLPPERRHLAGRTHEEIIANGVVLVFERLWQTKDGEEIPVQLHDAPLRDAKGEIIGVIGVARDMRQVKGLIAELGRSKAFIESVFSTIADPIVVTNSDKVILAVNKAVTQLLGYGEEELVGHNYVDVLVSPERRHLSGKTTEEVIAKGVTLIYERIWRTKDGEEIPVAIHNAPLRDAQGRVIGTIAAARDMRQVKSLIAELERSKEELARSEEFLHAVINSLSDELLVVDRDFCITAVNTAALQKHGATRSAIIGQHCYKLHHGVEEPCSSTDYECPVRKVWETGEATRVTHEHVYKPGEEGEIVDISASPLRDSQGNITEVVLLVRDVTETKRLEQEKAEAWERYRAILEHAPDPIIVTDADNIVRLWNKRAEEDSGYKAEEMIGKSAGFFVPPELHEEAKWLREEALEKGSVENYETVRVVKDGTRVPVELTIGPLRDGRGNLMGFIVIVRDISERKRLEREKAEAQERLVRAERLASIGQVASSVAHELRQPLSVINNSVYFLRMQLPDAGEKVEKHLGILEKEVAASERIISDLLDLAKPEKLYLKPAELNSIIEQALSRAQLPQGVEVITELKELPAITADSEQLERVFLNIILNAAQAMPDGGHLVISSDTEDNSALVKVQDSGSGIAEEHLGRVFEPLFSTKAGGFGLGLTISKSIVEALQGTIEVQSQLGHGTTVTVKLPLK